MTWDESEEFVIIHESSLDSILTYLFLILVAISTLIYGIVSILDALVTQSLIVFGTSGLAIFFFVKKVMSAKSDGEEHIIIGADGIEIEGEFIPWEDIANEHCIDLRYSAGLDNRFLCMDVQGEYREYKVGHMDAYTDDFNEIMKHFRSEWSKRRS